MTTSTTPNNAVNSDCETNGRYAKANPGGPGNPFARKTAALREALIDAVTPQDILEIATILLFNAKAGHLPSVKMLFQYVIGKPKPAVEPDTLDLNELQVLQASQLPAADFKEFVGKMPPELALDAMRAVRPEIDKQLRLAIADTLPPLEDDGDEPTDQQSAAPEPKVEQSREQERSTNGENGQCDDESDEEELDWSNEAPSTNGEKDALRPSKT